MSAKGNFKLGDQVRWRWMGSYVEGEIVKVYKKPTVKSIKGKKIKRNASEERPAYLVKSLAGNFALKLITEIESHKMRKVKYQGGIYKEDD